MKVLCIGRLDSLFEKYLTAEWPDITFCSVDTHEAAMKEIVDAEVVWGHINEELFQASRSLRWLQHNGAGMNWLSEVPGLVTSDVVVTNSAGAAADSVADQTMATLLALSRQIPELVKAQTQHRWIQPPEHSPITLRGRTLGILGFGHIGRAVSERASGFGMRILALDLHAAANRSVESMYIPAELDEFLVAIDDLAVCVPLTKETRGMISRKELKLLGYGGIHHRGVSGRHCG